MAYSDVCVSQSGKVCVSDRLNGKINIFKRDDVIFKLIDTVGVQSDKMIEGDSTKATLEEPLEKLYTYAATGQVSNCTRIQGLLFDIVKR